MTIEEAVNKATEGGYHINGSDGTETYSLFHMTLHSFLSHITPINIRDFTIRVLTPRRPPYPLASNGLLRPAHQRWRPDTSLV
jgi:hypothetical protein